MLRKGAAATQREHSSPKSHHRDFSKQSFSPDSAAGAQLVQRRVATATGAHWAPRSHVPDGDAAFLREKARLHGNDALSTETQVHHGEQRVCGGSRLIEGGEDEGRPQEGGNIENDSEADCGKVGSVCVCSGLWRPYLRLRATKGEAATASLDEID